MTDLFKRSFDDFSADRRYRYVMGHVWGEGKKLVSVALNPSVGSSEKNDPTNTRLERRAHAMGLDGVIYVNLFPFVAASPDDMKRAADPFGCRQRADDTILTYCLNNFVLCGWGVHGAHMERGAEVEKMLRAKSHCLHALELTNDGHPKHPLYIAYEKQPFVWHGDSMTDADKVYNDGVASVLGER